MFEQAAEGTVELREIWDTTTLMWRLSDEMIVKLQVVCNQILHCDGLTSDQLTYLRLVTHICVSESVNPVGMDSQNGLSPKQMVRYCLSEP